MFRFFDKKSNSDADKREPSANWNPKTRVLTCVDKKGHKTTRKNPSSMLASLYDVVKMEMVREEVHFTLHPKPERNKDGRNKPRLVTFNLQGRMVGNKVL